VLALLAKPSAAAVPLLVCVLDWGWYRRSASGTLPVVWIWAVIALAAAWVTKGQQRDEIMVYVPPPWLRPVIAARWHFIYISC
jgi:hypothetical protein